MHLKTDTGRNAHFSRVPTISRSRNAFSVSETHKTTIQFDFLYPIKWEYIYPGDTVSLTQNVMARLNTQVGTLYDDLYIDLHAWFVPMRLIQTNWARYQFNAQPGGPAQDNSALTSPKITLSGLGAGGFVAKTLYDYITMPTAENFSADTEHINNYVARAYNFTWNEDYRDQNLQDPVTVDLDDGPDDPADYVLLKRGKRHDKFTSALTAQQKGTAVTMPLGTSADIKTAANDNEVPTIYSDPQTAFVQMDTATFVQMTNQSGATPENRKLYADLATAVAPTLNAWRTSASIQHLLEADGRGGTRDVEAIQNRWGVTVPDYRLQRPEYLGGQTFTFDGHVVPQTSETNTTAQGTLKQFSSALSALHINHSFVEHGVFFILISCRSNITYQQGLRRELSYKTRYDWYQPEFANIGEVGIKNKEIYMDGSANDNNIFGYQEYGYELRYSQNCVTAEMRSNYATSKDSLHMADDYASLPTLGSAWIQSNTDIGRNIVVAPGTADPIELNTLCKGKIARTLPMYSIPGLWRL